MWVRDFALLHAAFPASSRGQNPYSSSISRLKQCIADYGFNLARDGELFGAENAVNVLFYRNMREAFVFRWLVSRVSSNRMNDYGL